MKTVTLKCTHCKKEFERRYSQYKQCNIKNKMKVFCNQSCKMSFMNFQKTPEWYKLHIGDRIKNHSGNLKDEYSPFKYFITKCKERKKQNNIEFDIDLEYIKKLWIIQNGICPYTGFEMILPETTHNHSKIHSLKKASLDRIDSTKGYIKGNVEFVCMLINFAKNQFTKNEVIHFISELKQIGTPDRN